MGKQKTTLSYPGSHALPSNLICMTLCCIFILWCCCFVVAVCISALHKTRNVHSFRRQLAEWMVRCGSTARTSMQIHSTLGLVYFRYGNGWSDWIFGACPRTVVCEPFRVFMANQLTVQHQINSCSNQICPVNCNVFCPTWYDWVAIATRKFMIYLCHVF